MELEKIQEIVKRDKASRKLLSDLDTKEKRESNFNNLKKFKKIYWSKKLNLITESTGEFDKIVSTYSMEDAKRDNLVYEFREYNAQSKRECRLRKRIKRLVISDRALFVTFTFNDLMLQREEHNLIRLVKKYLNDTCIEYVANVDYGSKNKRFHIHAIVVPKEEKLDFKKYRALTNESNINAKKIVFNSSNEKNEETSKKLARYITKLTRHTVKDNGKIQRVIYSRECRDCWVEITNEEDLPF